MTTRRHRGSAPLFIFTADFHELVAGDMIPGPIRLHYDPFRIVPVEEFSKPSPIRCYAEMLPLGQHWEEEYSVPQGVLTPSNYDPASQGFVISTHFQLPEGCDEVVMWFGYRRADGTDLWDSEYGKNYHLRFPLFDLHHPEGSVVASQDPAFDRLQVAVLAIPKVSSVTLRWRFTHPTGFPRREVALVAVGQEGERIRWSTPDGGVPVPTHATAVYDLVYTVGGRAFTDDNAGTWYLAEP